ncbi:MAG: AraC family transcriptional regulator [Myxococcota bacterium]|nr:AraC family transcriptional regulator [Myxococcota bacterium]
MVEISSTVTKALLKGISKYGVDAAAVMAAAGIDENLISDPDARISFDRHKTIWEEAARQSGDIYIGLHVAESVPIRELGIVVHLITACETVGKALEKFLYYQALLDSSFNATLDSGKNQTYLAFSSNLPPWVLPRQMAEASMALYQRGLSELLSPAIQPIAVEFQHSAPLSIAEHIRIFGAPVRFDRPRNALVFESHLLNLKIPGSNPKLLAVYEQQAKQMLSTLPKSDPQVQEVRRAIFEALSSGDLAMRSIGRKLGISQSSLRARLAKQNLTYRYLLFTMRRDLALSYLENKQWTITDIAFILGFSDPSAFKRTFRRWTGKTPSEYRRMLFE